MCQIAVFLQYLVVATFRFILKIHRNKPSFLILGMRFVLFLACSAEILVFFSLDIWQVQRDKSDEKKEKVSEWREQKSSKAEIEIMR